MPDPRETLLAVSDFSAVNSRHGIGGWATGGVPSRNISGNNKFISLHDTNGLSVKDVTADTWATGFTASNTPAGFIPPNNSYPSVFAADWAGQSNTLMWVVTDKKVLYGSIAGGFVDKTPSGGITTEPGKGQYRQVAQKCASDPIQGSVFVACFANGGFQKTLDGGTTWSTITNLPAPTHTVAGSGSVGNRSGQIVWDTSSSRTGTAPADRYSIGYASSGGQGIYKSTDGFGSVTKISPTGMNTTLWMGVRSGVLYAIIGDDADFANSATRNLYQYSGTGTTWTQLGDSGNPRAYFSAIFDVRATGDMLLNHTSGEMSYTATPATPSTYKTFSGDLYAGLFNQTKPKKRPFIANTYHNNGGGGAPGPLFRCDAFVYASMGYGYLRTPSASFPTAGASYVPNYSTVWPDWEEDSDGYEAIVGNSVCWGSNALWCNAQDVGTIVFHDDQSGHDATYSEFPGYTLTNAIGISVDPANRSFGAVGSYKNGPNFAYTTNGRTFTKLANQPSNANPLNTGGAVVTGHSGATKLILHFPTVGGVPVYYDDLGASAPKTLAFYKTASGTGSPVDVSYRFNGFNGDDYYTTFWCCIADPNNAGVFYAYNRGGATSAANNKSSSDVDAAGNAGVYKCDWGVEPGVFRRVLSGAVLTTGDRGYYRLNMEITADNHLLIMNSPLYSNNTGNKSADVDLTALTSRQISTVYDIEAWALGASLYPGGPQGLWAAGYYSNTFALWLSFDRFQTAPWGPSGTPKAFSHRTPLGGAIVHMDAHPTTFGLLGVALEGGHARLRLQA